jgi:hypothetical protein
MEMVTVHKRQARLGFWRSIENCQGGFIISCLMIDFLGLFTIFSLWMSNWPWNHDDLQNLQGGLTEVSYGDGDALIGRSVVKKFSRKKFTGCIVAYDPHTRWYKVLSSPLWPMWLFLRWRSKCCVEFLLQKPYWWLKLPLVILSWISHFLWWRWSHCCDSLFAMVELQRVSYLAVRVCARNSVAFFLQGSYIQNCWQLQDMS